MEKISFTKMSGAGNDFIILKNFQAESLKSVLIQRMCDRRDGIGADGIITISRAEDADFRMQYFNSDGSTGSLCGNGARCAIKFAHSEGYLKSEKVHFYSGRTEYTGEVLNDGRIRFDLKPPADIKRNFRISLDLKELSVSFINTGSPHVVVYIGEIWNFFGTKYGLEEIPVQSLGREIRYNSAFSPGGSNVNFLHIDEGNVYIRTYERGVEDETLACGTGSVAAALISFLEGMVKPPVHVYTRSGEKLEVNFRFVDDGFSDVSLTGPAKIIFTGEYST